MKNVNDDIKNNVWSNVCDNLNIDDILYKKIQSIKIIANNNVRNNVWLNMFYNIRFNVHNKIIPNSIQSNVLKTMKMKNRFSK